MAFTVFHGSGALQYDGDEAMQQALQYPDSVQQVCPGVDLLLLTDVHAQVFYALGSEFTMSETQFGACVATKWNITNWSENRPCMCRFNIGSKVTVTYAYYSALYQLEHDLGVLSQKPHFSQHFICIVIQRTFNWKTMVQLCSRVLQIQYPTYNANQCPTLDEPNIVLIGWQRFSTVARLLPLQVFSGLQLRDPVQHQQSCRQITEFNSSPAYVLSYVMQSVSTPRLKKCALVQKKTAEVPPSLPPSPSGALQEEKQTEVPEMKAEVVIDIFEGPSIKKGEEEDWVMTVLYEDE